MTRLLDRLSYPIIPLLMLLPLLARADLPDFTGLVERVAPAVVNIEATRTVEAAMRQGNPAIDDEEMQEFFRRFFGNPGQPGRPQPPLDRTSMGSGFIISADGYVLTNHHVIEGANEVFVRLADRREYKAKVIGSDPQADVALLKIEAKSLPVVMLGNAHALKPGQWVVAIGSPFGFEHSVTAGIVSAVGRASGAQQYVPFIQTDVPINRGNSGGPLFNIDGQVVGINSQIFSNTGGYLGISFAIPIDVAMNAVEQLKATGKVTRGLLGVQIQEVTRELAESLGLPKPEGAIVRGFSEDSAGKKAGMEIGDVIVSFNDIPITRSSELPPLVGSVKPGTRVPVEVFRNGSIQKLNVAVGALESDQVAEVDSAAPGAHNALGLTVENLTADQRRELGLNEGEGVLITAVTGIAAQRARLQEGDVILMVGRERVGSVGAFEAAVTKANKGHAIMLLIRRGDATQFVAITPEAAK